MKSSDPCYIPMMENIRALLKNTILAHPDDIKADERKKTTTPKKQDQKKKSGR